MREVVVAGVGMTPFGKWRERSTGSLVAEAVAEALEDARIEKPAEWRVVYYSRARNPRAGSTPCGTPVCPGSR
ncbi:hypothetical protein [Prauserella sp. PE36]|uniref:hypothetical protein n=1 Tax=Prauserella sp. PE36 TaxID=1504709 RepID=UPI0013150309|nr:hypothetical protein [Prauserella sp. PE36]